jgi:hypothetical protein
MPGAEKSNQSTEQAAERRWICRKPAVSFIDVTPTIELVMAADLQGIRVCVVPARPKSVPSLRGRHDGRLPPDDGNGLITSIVDTSVTVMGPVRATARALGIVLTLKNSYHVALVLGVSVMDPREIGAEIARSSEKTLGPDFGLCFDATAGRFADPLNAQGEALIRASDRRAFETIRPLYEAINSAAIFQRF